MLVSSGLGSVLPFPVGNHQRARQGKARRGLAWLGKARQGEAWPGLAGQGEAWLGKALVSSGLGSVLPFPVGNHLYFDSH